MVPDSQANLHSSVEFLAKDEFSSFDPELYPRVAEKLKAREALIKEYVDVRKLAYVASGLGEKGLQKL
ncbi:MAG: hypothetical protein JSR37_07250 [Verrucomicrobia bacterium]|nr:hypothetical protein [Verrucomicrobiota bacterium]MBS0636605.1 hypothetical protein [Verrucomicrobiota bacterium]